MRAAAPDLATSSRAASASAAAFSAASLAFSAASCAFSEATMARSEVSWARLPSRSTIATSCSMVALSWSRARAMYWPVVRNQLIADGEPSSRARWAYFFTSGEAVERMRRTSTRSSSWRAVIWLSSRNRDSASLLPSSSAF